jgi:hypothetical protein
MNFYSDFENICIMSSSGGNSVISIKTIIESLNFLKTTSKTLRISSTYTIHFLYFLSSYAMIFHQSPPPPHTKRVKQFFLRFDKEELHPRQIKQLPAKANISPHSGHRGHAPDELLIKSEV